MIRVNDHKTESHSVTLQLLDFDLKCTTTRGCHDVICYFDIHRPKTSEIKTDKKKKKHLYFTSAFYSSDMRFPH